MGQTLGICLGAVSSQLRDRRAIAPRKLEDSDKSFKLPGWEERGSYLRVRGL